MARWQSDFALPILQPLKDVVAQTCILQLVVQLGLAKKGMPVAVAAALEVLGSHDSDSPGDGDGDGLAVSAAKSGRRVHQTAGDDGGEVAGKRTTAWAWCVEACARSARLLGGGGGVGFANRLNEKHMSAQAQ